MVRLSSVLSRLNNVIWFLFKNIVIHCSSAFLYAGSCLSSLLWWVSILKFFFLLLTQPYQICLLLQNLCLMGSNLGRNALPHSTVLSPITWVFLKTDIENEETASGSFPSSSLQELKASIFISCFELLVMWVFSKSLRWARALGLFTKGACKESKKTGSGTLGAVPNVSWRMEVQMYCSPNTAQVSLSLACQTLRKLPHWQRASVWCPYVIIHHAKKWDEGRG